MSPEDSRLAVRFYQRECENEWMTNQEGRPIKYMADFVRIEVPGDMLSVIDTFVNDGHKKRFPMQWAQYLNDKSESGTTDAQGTLLRDWSLLTASQASELKHYKFYTVEQIANASDQQIQAIGMLVGMAPMSFRDKARAYLANAKDNSTVMAQAEELRKRDQEIQDLKEQMQRLIAATERKAGRPRKEAVEAE